MATVSVYNYIIFNSDNHQDVPGARMATAEAIRRLNGDLNRFSEKQVDESEIDEDGFYPIVNTGAEPRSC